MSAGVAVKVFMGSVCLGLEQGQTKTDPEDSRGLRMGSRWRSVFEHEQNLAFFYRLARGDTHLLDHAGPLGLELILHLHGLERHQARPRRNLITRLHLNPDHELHPIPSLSQPPATPAKRGHREGRGCPAQKKLAQWSSRNHSEARLLGS